MGVWSVNMELSKRKHPRLMTYDYSSGGGYFITICTQGKKHILSHITPHTAQCFDNVQPIVGAGVPDGPQNVQKSRNENSFLLSSYLNNAARPESHFLIVGSFIFENVTVFSSSATTVTDFSYSSLYRHVHGSSSVTVYLPVGTSLIIA